MFMKNKLDFMSRSNINKYIQFYRDYPVIVDAWEKSGKPIGALTITSGLDLVAKLNNKRGKTLEEHAKQTIKLKRKDKDHNDDHAPLKKKQKITNKQKVDVLTKLFEIDDNDNDDNDENDNDNNSANDNNAENDNNVDNNNNNMDVDNNVKNDNNNNDNNNNDNPKNKKKFMLCAKAQKLGE